jgi:hypothetical protein
MRGREGIDGDFIEVALPGRAGSMIPPTIKNEMGVERDSAVWGVVRARRACVEGRGIDGDFIEVGLPVGRDR